MALPKMSKAALAAELADRLEWSVAGGKKVLDELEEIVRYNLTNCVRTSIAGVTIEPKMRPATKKRMGRNPQTGEAVQIAAKPASVRVVARVSKSLKEDAPTTKKLKANL